MSILNDFREAIAVQQRKEDEAYEEQIKLPIDERVEKGLAMNNLRVVFDFHDGAPNEWCPHLTHPYKFIRSAKVHCPNNISKFREGSQIMLSNGSAFFDFPIPINFSTHSRVSATLISVSSDIEYGPILTANASGRNLLPEHVEQGTNSKNF